MASSVVDLSDPSPRRAWWPPVVLWTAGVVLYAGVLWQEIGLPFLPALLSSAVYLYSLALLTIPARRWTWRTMAARQAARAGLLAHAAVGTATIAAWLGVNMLYQRVMIGPTFWKVVYDGNFLFQVIFAVAVYGLVLGVTMATHSWRRERDRERREAALTILARDVELGAIRAQFQPHFVLNALNSLLALIDRDPALARTMVVRLADVMKAVFEGGDAPAVPLDRELAVVKAYLDVEQIRFGARLSTVFDVDEAARSVLVPPFLLQPIVENAVKHGVAPFTHPGTVRVRARVEGSRLRLEVQDTGAGGPITDTGGGRGLQITRRRLETVYGSDCDLTLERGEAGCSVRLVIPIEVAGVA